MNYCAFCAVIEGLRVEMSAWLYIAAGIVVFVAWLSAFVLMSISDDWKQVDGEVNNGEGWNG